MVAGGKITLHEETGSGSGALGTNCSGFWPESIIVKWILNWLGAILLCKYNKDNGRVLFGVQIV